MKFSDLAAKYKKLDGVANAVVERAASELKEQMHGSVTQEGNTIRLASDGSSIAGDPDYDVIGRIFEEEVKTCLE